MMRKLKGLPCFGGVDTYGSNVVGRNEVKDWDMRKRLEGNTGRRIVWGRR